MGCRPEMSRFRFLSTPSARRATRGHTRYGAPKPISIHALREEGDWCHNSRPIYDCRFLSTPSARRATLWDTPEASPVLHFYPRPPRGGRRTQIQLRLADRDISIHALREEGDRR